MESRRQSVRGTALNVSGFAVEPVRTHLIFFLITCSAVFCAAFVAGCGSIDPDFQAPIEDGAFVAADVETVDAEKYGWSAEKLEQVRLHADSLGTAALMILTDGEIVAAWGNIERTYLLHSIRKSMLSLLYGVYVEKRLIDLSKTLKELEIDDISPLTDLEKRATINDLLKSRSGVYHDAASVSLSDAAGRPARGSYDPDENFYYNNWDFNVLGTIFEQETGIGIFDALALHLAGPLGMKDFDLNKMYHIYESERSMHSAYHMRISARDLALVGQLVLQKGRWEGEQIIPSDWISDSTFPYSDFNRAGTGGGFGYMWWIATGSDLSDELEIEDGAVSGSGSGGHKLTILPSINTVVVHRVNTDLISGPRVRGYEYDRLLTNIVRSRL